MAEEPQPSNPIPKPYDVIILGASGFTGKYVIREALKFLNAPNSPLASIALAGRSPSRLSQALNWALSHSPKTPIESQKIPLLTADTSDAASLTRLAAQARVILNCVGPFRLYGRPVVEACVESGCDYLDITGEPEFMERMEAEFHEKASQRGSLVISACGFDSVPAEMGVLFHVKKWAEFGGTVSKVDAYLSLESEKGIVGNVGTYESAVLGVANMESLAKFRRSRPRKARLTIPGPPSKGPLIEHQKELGLWAVKLPSADATVVRRTFLTLNENLQGLPGVHEAPEHVEKRESFWSSVKPAHFGVKLGTKSPLGLIPVILLGIMIGLLGRFSLGRWLLLKFPSFFSFGVFRKEGPSEEQVSSASFKMWFVGRGYSDVNLASNNGNKPDTEVITRVMGPEVGYVTTPITLLQCALVLLRERDNLPKGGVYTTGIVFGPTDLQERLQENGISFDFVSKKALST